MQFQNTIDFISNLSYDYTWEKMELPQIHLTAEYKGSLNYERLHLL